MLREILVSLTVSSPHYCQKVIINFKMSLVSEVVQPHSSDGSEVPLPVNEATEKATWQATKFLDMEGRPATSVWKGVASLPPKFSWQVYCTIGIEVDLQAVAVYLGAEELHDQGYDVRFDFYAPLPHVFACIEHQTQERLHRKEPSQDSNSAGVIPYQYGFDSILRGLAIVLDMHQWMMEGKGPLCAHFDIRPPNLKIIEQGQFDEEFVFEQMEMIIMRECQSKSICQRLKDLYYPNWEHAKVSAQENSTAIAPLQNTPDYADFSGNISLRTVTVGPSQVPGLEVTTPNADQDLLNVSYSVYVTFPPPSSTELDLTEIGRAFTTSLLSNLKNSDINLRLHFFTVGPHLGTCLKHHRDTQSAANVGYLSWETGKRCHPNYMLPASGTAKLIRPYYRSFIVLLDKARWEKEDGVSFVWTGFMPQPNEPFQIRQAELIVARLPGMNTAAGRLVGII